MTGGQNSIDRRALIATALATLVTACSTCPPLDAAPPTRAKMGDSHVHLFNAADLPVAGFVRFVILPEYLPHIPEVGLALIDAALSVLKAMAPSAAAELRQNPRDAPPRAFADRLGNRIDTMARPARQAATLRPAEDVAHSYAVLGALLEAADPTGGAANATTKSPTGATVDRAFLARVAVEGRAAARPDVGVRAGLSAIPSVSFAGVRGSDDLGALWDTIKWFYEMVLPRCRHLHDYLATISDSEHATDLIVNLLVDYDAWLGDQPSSGSSMIEQLRFWDRYGAGVADRVTIKTFAGYDPLRHAEDRLATPAASLYWDQLKSCLDPPSRGGAPLASGFKIYPPMGFRVSCNRGHEPERDRSGRLVRQRWDRNGWHIPEFGDRIEDVLDDFFRFCAGRDIPVVAHGRNSQEASKGTGEFASPQYWHERANWVWAQTGRPLRASIAHWSMTPEYREWMPKILALNVAGKANIFFDIGYTQEFLDGDGPGYLADLAQVYSPCEKTAKWLMFGSDWIMLEREPGVKNYLANAVAAIRAVDFWRPHEAPLLRENLRRFLTPGV
ncbi:hypothetical protein [Sphingomonas sp.]|uniref:hypothetical protein n=1 Tax=Sphingomonas sp. TaxID=28214 RepID=UPI002E30E104|nr:hypothetical protein [Sphingomonas sp.]HEX4693611.1 hypothetical protein [Sphingomonas sp.]